MYSRPLTSYSPNSFVLPTSTTEFCQRTLEIERGNHSSPVPRLTGCSDSSPWGRPAWARGPASFRKAAPKGSNTLALQKRAKTSLRGLVRMQVAHRKRARTSTALAANAKLSTITGDPPNATKHQTSVTKTLQTPPNLENSSSSSCSKEELTYKDVRPLAVINHGLADKRLPLRNPASGGGGPGRPSDARRTQSVLPGAELPGAPCSVVSSSLSPSHRLGKGVSAPSRTDARHLWDLQCFSNHVVIFFFNGDIG